MNTGPGENEPTQRIFSDFDMAAAGFYFMCSCVPAQFGGGIILQGALLLASVHSRLLRHAQGKS